LELKLYNVAGELIWTLTKECPAGRILLDWDAKNLNGLAVASGQYYLLAGMNSESDGRWLSLVR
jgi:hypothetical protein